MQGTIVVIDTETTDKEIVGTGVCQVAAVGMTAPAPEAMNNRRDTRVDPWHIWPIVQTYARPSFEMKQGAFETHGIGPEKYWNAPDDATALWAVNAILGGLAPPVILAGYNCTRYDFPVMDNVIDLGFSKRPQIDAFTLMLRDAPEYGLKLTQVFERLCGAENDYLGLSQATHEAFLHQAHDALADCWMTAAVLRYWLTKHSGEFDSLEAIANWARTPHTLPVMPFGKHKGKEFGDIPDGYIQWMKRTWTDTHPDLELSIRDL